GAIAALLVLLAAVPALATQTPDFSLSANPAALSIVRHGSSVTSTITVSSQQKFSSVVSLSASSVTNGINPSLSPTSVTPPSNGNATSTLTVSLGNNVPTGSYVVTVTGTGGGQTHSLDIPVTVTDFSVSCSPSTLSV